ncbi:MAG TPA: hypothetical protein PKN92_01185 [Candidatus Hydrogenedentes bacterium]|jgi:hypothetical protein|nr:hypothetical protein [Candidatus Hydrogenedentota bacterium]
MKNRTVFIAGLFCVAFASLNCSQEQPSIQYILPPFGDNIPGNYQLVAEADFSSESCLNLFEFTDPSSWKPDDRHGRPCLNLIQGVGAYKPPVRSPFSFALLKDLQVEDFILEMDVESTDLAGGNHRDACFIFGFTARDSFYYVHVAAAADPHAHNIFIVDKKPRVNIGASATKGVGWGKEVVHRIRIERTVADGRIAVYFNDMEKPVLEGNDTRLAKGNIGFGSFDNSCCFYEMRLYAPDVTRCEQSLFFTAKN